MPGIDYARAPAEDFARASLTYEDDAGLECIVEATTSWSFVGSGLRLSFELLGPEYALAINSLDTDMKVFLSREVRGSAGEDLVEKQNAEQGLAPVLASEPAYYGYEEENRHMVESFRAGAMPRETWADGLDVVRTLMACYQAAEEERTLEFPPAGLDAFVPAVARGAWRPA
jgi:predicted dehydrogenase